MQFEHVLVVGAGQMGGGIAQVVAASGRRVSLHDAAPGATERGLAAMRKSLERLAEKGGADADEVLGRVTAVEEIVPADLLIEAVIEDASVKEAIFRRADEVLPEAAILASNTSSIPITSLAAATGAARPRDRDALLQPGPGAEARRGDPRGPDLRRDRRGDHGARARISGRCRRRRTTSPASSRTGS